jgi:hypothetical protein
VCSLRSGFGALIYRCNLWPFQGTLWHPIQQGQRAITLVAMPRRGKLTGVPAQLREAARRNLDPAKIAANPEAFSEVFALPRVVHELRTGSPTDLDQARALVSAVRNELAQMKTPPPYETDPERSEREWQATRIDGIYSLTSYWSQYKYITNRREILCGGEPGSGVDTQTLRDGTEREIHEQLAERLSREPSSTDGLAVLGEASQLLGQIEGTSDADEDLQLWMLFVYAANRNTLDLARQIVGRLIVDRERQGSDAPANVGWAVFGPPGPPFSHRESSALEYAHQESATLHPFLRSLEDHSVGRQVISKWKDWLAAADWEALHQALLYAERLLDDGAGADVLREIEDSGSLDYARSHGDFLYMIGIGAVLGDEACKGPWESQPFWRFSYWPRRERESQSAPPEGWVQIMFAGT